MGILVNALSISSGCLLGSIFKEKINFKNLGVLGIAIMIISLTGFIENTFGVEELILKSRDITVVIFTLIAGTVIADISGLDSKLSYISGIKNNELSGIMDSTVFFGVGGMQICGPIMLATNGGNELLIMKSVIDFPFALMFGISYGKKSAISSLPVALGQIIILLITMWSENFVDTYFINQVCAMGYIVLFFSGFNLICEKQHKINNTGMLMGFVPLLLYNVVRLIWR